MRHDAKTPHKIKSSLLSQKCSAAHNQPQQFSLQCELTHNATNENSTAPARLRHRLSLLTPKACTFPITLCALTTPAHKYRTELWEIVGERFSRKEVNSSARDKGCKPKTVTVIKTIIIYRMGTLSFSYVVTMVDNVETVNSDGPSIPERLKMTSSTISVRL